MANDLVTRLLLNNSNFDNNLTRSTQLILNFQLRCRTVSNSVGNGFNSIIGVAKNMVPALAAITSTAALLQHGFESILASNQNLSDGLDTLKSKTEAVDSAFWLMLGSNGSLTAFLQGLDDIKEKALKAAEAADALGSAEIFSKVLVDYFKSKANEERALARMAKSEEERNLHLLKAEDYMKSADEALMTYSEAVVNNGVQNLNNKMGLTQLDGYYLQHDFTDEELLQRFIGTTQKEADKMIEDFTREWNAKVAKEKEAMIALDVYSLGGPGTVLVKTGTRFEPTIESLRIHDENQKWLNEHPIEVLFTAGGKSNTVEGAMGDMRMAYTKAQQYSEQLATQAAKLNQQQNKTSESARKAAEDARKAAEEMKKVAEAANKAREILTQNVLVFNTSTDNTVNTITNIFDDENIVEKLKQLPDRIIAEFEPALTKFQRSQNILNLRYLAGLIDADQYNSLSLSLLNSLWGDMALVSTSAVVSLDKMALNEVVHPLLNSIANRLIKGTKEQKAQSTFYSELKTHERGFRSLGSGISNWYKQADTSLKDEYGNYSELISIYKSGEALIESLKKERNELIQAAEAAAMAIEGGADGGDKYLEMILGVNRAIEDLGKGLEKIGAISEKVKKDMDMASAISSIGKMGNALASCFEAAGEKEAAWFIQSLSQIAELIAGLANMAITAGVASAAKLPYPYNLAAIASSVAVIGGIVASAMQTFTDGGVVKGGSYSGDSTMIRVNAGEMVLNQGQLARLFKMLNEGRSTEINTGGDVHFRIQGRDLVGVLNNYNHRMSKLM